MSKNETSSIRRELTTSSLKNCLESFPHIVLETLHTQSFFLYVETELYCHSALAGSYIVVN